MNDEWGSNKQLSRPAAEVAVLKEVQRLAMEDGRKDVPRKTKRFRKKATVLFLDAAGNQVHFDRVVVAWED